MAQVKFDLCYKDYPLKMLHFGSQQGIPTEYNQSAFIILKKAEENVDYISNWACYGIEIVSLPKISGILIEGLILTVVDLHIQKA